MLGSPPPATYQPSAVNRQTNSINDVPGLQGIPGQYTPLGMSASSFMPPSSMTVPSSMQAPSSYMPPSSYMAPSNIPQNPNPDPMAQQNIGMMVQALQGGVRT